MEYKFIGDENDIKTKKWGLKNGATYEIQFPAFPPRGLKKEVAVFIKTPSGEVVCPYSSVESFDRNWKELHKKKRGRRKRMGKNR